MPEKRSEGGACGRICHPLPGGSGPPLDRHHDRSPRSSVDSRQIEAGNARQVRSQETRELKLSQWRMRSPWRVPQQSAGRRARPERARCRSRGAGSWQHELALRGIGWMRLSALRSLFDCRGRVYFCAWSWVELGHDMSRERCRASAPAKRGRGTTRRVVEGAAEQTIMRAFRKDDSPQLDLGKRVTGGGAYVARPGICWRIKGLPLIPPRRNLP